MEASSASSASFTSSRAERSAVGSMRMSSGASAAYEKPRSGRSSCIDETPRSSRIASARTPLSASWRRTTEKSPRSSRDCSPGKRRLNRAKYGRTVGSRSIAMSLPRPSSRSASRALCPPAPKVPSTTVSPGRTSSRSTTSWARTGTWSVALGKAFGNILSTPFDLRELAAPRLAVPDLDVVVDAGDHDLASQPGVLDERRRDVHAPLLVELPLGRAGEEEALHAAPFLAQRVERGEAAPDEAVPRALRVRVEAPVHAAGHDDPARERGPELRRERESVLVVDGVFEFAEQHGVAPGSSPTSTHSKPRYPTPQAFLPTSSACTSGQ